MGNFTLNRVQIRAIFFGIEVLIAGKPELLKCQIRYHKTCCFACHRITLILWQTGLAIEDRTQQLG